MMIRTEPVQLRRRRRCVRRGGRSRRRWWFDLLPCHNGWEGGGSGEELLESRRDLASERSAISDFLPECLALDNVGSIESAARRSISA